MGIALTSRLVPAAWMKTDEESVASLCVNSAVPFSASPDASDVLNVDFHRRVIQLRQLACVERTMMSVSAAIRYDLNSAVSSRSTA